MSNYPTRSRWGRVGAAVVALAIGAALYALFESAALAGAAALGAAASTFVGSIYPDIDHHDSIPRRKATQAFRALVVLGVVVLILVGLSLATFLQGPGGFGQSQPVEIGTSSGD